MAAVELCKDKKELIKALDDLKNGANEKFNIRQLQPEKLEKKFRAMFKANLKLFKTLLRWTRA